MRLKAAGLGLRIEYSMQRVLRFASRMVSNAGEHWKLALVLILGLSTTLSGVLALTRRPWCDEAWFASPAYNLAKHGFLGMTILDPHGFIFAPFIEGIHQFTFWVLPMYLLAQSAWYKSFGFDLFTMRALSMAWGLVALLSWFSIVKHLTRDRCVALLATFLLGVEQHFTMSAATGRMDIMCAALGLASFAAYLRLRERTVALYAASCVLAIALFTHPNALFGGIMLAAFVILYDRDRLSTRTLVLASIPFIVCGGLWGLYVMQAPDAFISQMSAQSKIPHRFQLPLNVFSAVRNEIVTRYGGAYRLQNALPLGVQALTFYFYVGAVVLVAAVRDLRNSAGARFLLTLTGLFFLLLTCLQKNWYYVVFILPLFTSVGALAISWLWKQSSTMRILAISIIAVTTALHIGMVGVRVARNDYRNQFLRVTDYLRREAPQDALIIGSGELAFELGFDGRVVDDARLGYGSGKRPDFIVLDTQYRVFWFNWLSVSEPQAFAYMINLIRSDYDLVFDTESSRFTVMNYSEVAYQVYKRRDPE